MKNFFILLAFFCFLVPNSYAKKPKPKKNCYDFFIKADKDKDGFLNFVEFDTQKRINKKLKKSKLSYEKLFSRINIDADEKGISSDEYKTFCETKKESKLKKNNKNRALNKSNKSKKRALAPLKNKTVNTVVEKDAEPEIVEPVVSNPDTAPIVEEPTKEDAAVLKSIEDSE